MSVLTAAVVLAWGCLTVLTLAMAGMLRQLRELHAEVVQLGAAQRHCTTGRLVPDLAGTRPLILLVLDPGCGFCDAVYEPFTELAGQHQGVRFEVLSPRPRWDGGPTVRSQVDQRLVAELDLPWAPALLHVDAGGMVLASQPVRSPERLGEQVTELLTVATHRQGAA